MSRITRQCIEALKLHVNIYDVVAPSVQLKRQGRNWVGLSPFQPEKTPSFFVLPDKGIYKCFSSGLAGDIFKFLEETEKVSFIEAVEMIAERFNQPLEYEQGSGPAPEERSLKRQLLELHEYAAEFFHQALLADQPDSAACRRYWEEQRGFPLELAKDFKIGFAPVRSSKLNEHLLKKGFTEKAMRECGLFYAQDYDPDPLRFRQRFRGRLMVPIRDRQGQVIAFTARQLEITPGDDPAREAKYINSPGTPLFNKSHLVFNLERAREAVRETDSFVLVEGQLDAIRCWHEGIQHTIAPQGTSITPEQMKLLRPYASRLDVVLDGDNAGQKAALRMLPLALAADLTVQFALLPEGQDPDSFLRAQGADAFRDLLAAAEPAMPFAARALLPPEPTPADLANFVTELARILQPCPSEVARFAYFDEAMEAVRIDRAAAEADFRRALARLGHRPTTAPEASSPQSSARPAAPAAPRQSAEEELALVFLHRPELAPELAQLIDPETLDYERPGGRMLGWIIGEILEGHPARELDPRFGLEDEADQKIFFELLSRDQEHLSVEFANTALRRFHQLRLDRRKKNLGLRIANAKDPAEVEALLRERQAIIQELRQAAFPALRNPRD